MSKINKKSILIICWSLVVLWMGVIFYMSSQDGGESGNTSEPIARFVVEMQVNTGRTAPSNLNSQYYIDQVEVTVRMVAHSMIFFILSVLVCISLLVSGIKGFKVFFLAVIFSIIYAFLDELHQFFVPGRENQILDIMLDTIGVGIGAFLTTSIYTFFASRSRKLHNKTSKPVIKKSPILSNTSKVPQQHITNLTKEKNIAKDVLIAKKPKTITKEYNIILPIWLKFGFIISFSILCAILGSSPSFMLISGITSFLIMIILVFKYNILDNNLKKLNIFTTTFSLMLTLITLLSVYASFRLIANSYIAANSIVIQDLYYNFIRGGLCVFSAPALMIVWYIIIVQVKQFIRQLKVTKVELLYISFISIASFMLCFIIHMKINIFYMPFRDKLLDSAVMLGINSSDIISQFTHTNFTSTTTSIIQPIFALGALPFGVFSKIVSYGLHFVLNISVNTSDAIGLSMMNAFAISISCIMLSRLVPKGNRLLYLSLITIAFPSLIFIPLISTGTIALFYISLFLYISLNTDNDYSSLLMLSSVTFMPSAILPILVSKKPKDFKYILKSYIYLIFAIIIFFNINMLKDFNLQHTPTIIEYFKTYLVFISTSILAPPLEIITSPIYAMNIRSSSIYIIIGIVIGFLSLLGFIYNKREKIAQISFLWIVIGFFHNIYCLLFQSSYNMFVFTLCYSWAFIILVYLLVQKLLKNHDIIFKTITIPTILIIGAYNISQIYELIVFGLNYYRG